MSKSSLRATSVALLAVLLTGLLASAASAEVKGRIVSIQARNGQLNVVFAAAGLTKDQQIDPDSLRVTLGGEDLEHEVQQGGAAALGVTRRVVLAIDTSGSMAGDRIVAARVAATAYLARVPADVSVGLVTFSSTARSVISPTTDRGPIRAAVQRLTPSGDTALYDAVQLAVQQLGTTGDRSILLLSDGRDEGSRTTLAATQAAVRRAKIPVNAVLLENTDAGQALNTLSQAGGGRVVAARAAGSLTAAFVEAAQQARKELVLTAPIPQRFTGGEAVLSVSAVAAGSRINDSALAVNLVSAAAAEVDPAAFGPKPVEPARGLLTSSGTLYGGLAALFLGAGVLFTVALAGAGSAQTQTMSRRLSPYGATGRGRSARAEEADRSVRDAAVDIAAGLVRRRGLEDVLGRKLEAGGVPLKPAEWLIVHVGIALVLPLLVVLLSNFNIALSAVAVALGAFGPLLYLTVKEALRTRKFLAQLPDTLQLMSGSLSAGYSLPQALDAVVRQGVAPMADELRKALIEARLGAPVEDALDDVAARMRSKDFAWVVMAIRIQRQVGGNLAEVLSTTAATLRERERLRRQVQVLSAEGRLSAYILGGLPVVFSLYLLAARPEYLAPLVTDPLGIVMLIGMGIFMAVGAVWLRKVVTVDV